MEDLGDRLQKALDLRRRDAASLIRSLGCSKGMIYNILDHKTQAESIWGANALAISRELRISFEWFITGEGNMEPAQASNDEDFDDIVGYAQDAGLSEGVEIQEYVETHRLKFRIQSLQKEGLLGRDLAVMYGKGDSMLDRIHDGDAILYDRSDTRPLDEGLFVIQLPGVAGADLLSVKECEVLDDGVRFKAKNPKGDHHWRKPRRMDDRRHPITIVGRVRWIASWER